MRFRPLTGLLALAGCLLLAPPLLAADIEADPNSTWSGISFGNNGREEINVYAGVHEMGDKVAVCGVVVNQARAGSLRLNESKVTRQVQFRISGQKLIVRTEQFNRFGSIEEAEAGKGGCFVTRTAWQPEFAKTELDLDASSVSYSD